MAILKHSDYYNVVLEIVSELGPLHRRVLKDEAARRVNLSDEEKSQTNQRGTNIFGSRIHWSSTVLILAGILERPQRAMIGITPLGKRLLAEYPGALTEEIVSSQDMILALRERRKGQKKDKSGNFQSSVRDDSEQTPLESLEQAVAELEQAVASDLIGKIQKLEPEALEKLMLKLLSEMGYGASNDSIKHLGGVGDEGIDGVIYQDQLGFHKIYMQAKRYKTGNNISSETMNSFIGAIERKGGIGGVFVTTSDFTDGALKAAAEAPKHIALVNGQDLANLLIKNSIGVKFPRAFREVELDEEFFDELSD